MTKKTRRVLFLGAVALFVLLSILVLIFAFGFRYDFSNNILVKTGSIVLKPNSEAKIFINNKLEGGTSFLNNFFSKKSLLPGTYLVKVTKDKYFTWQKKINVREGLISDFSHIVLFNQEQIEPTVINRTPPFSIDRISRNMVYLQKGTISLYNLNEDKQPIYEGGPTIWDPATLKIIWGTDGKDVIAYDQTRATYFDLVNKTFYNLGTSKQFSLTTATLNDGRIYFLRSLSKAPLGTGRDLISFSVEQSKSIIVSKNVVSFFTDKNEIFVLAKVDSLASEQFIKTGLDGKNEEILGVVENFKQFQNARIRKIDNRNGAYFILINSDLYSLKNGVWVLISKNVGDFAISPNNAGLGWYTGREFWVEWLKDTEYQPLKKAGEKELITRADQDILSFSWYKNSSYIFIESLGSLVVSEVDLRGGINSYSILDLGTQGQAWYDLGQDKIFKLSNLNGLASVNIP